MKLSEIANTKNIKLKDSKRVEYKTLKMAIHQNYIYICYNLAAFCGRQMEWAQIFR